MKVKTETLLSAIVTVAICAVFQSSAFGECWYLELKYCSGTSSLCDPTPCTEMGGVSICQKEFGTKPSNGTWKEARPVEGLETGEDDHDTDYTDYAYCTVAETCINYDEFCLDDYCEGNGVFNNFGMPTYSDMYTVSAQPCP